MSAPEPKVNDAYWFEFAKTQADAALSNRDTAAEKLQELVKWLWPLYTAAAGVAVLFSNRVLSPRHVVLVAAAGVSLILVYWAATWVQVPKLISADPRKPDELREGFSTLVKSKHRRLMLALVLSTLAAGLVAASLAVTAGGREASEPGELEAPHLAGALVRDDDATVLAVMGLVGEAEIARLEVHESPEGERLTLQRLIPTDDGVVAFNLPVADGISAVRISLRWIGTDGITIQLTRTVGAQQLTS